MSRANGRHSLVRLNFGRRVVAPFRTKLGTTMKQSVHTVKYVKLRGFLMTFWWRITSYLVGEVENDCKPIETNIVLCNKTAV